MDYVLEVSENAGKKLKKLKRKDNLHLMMVLKKIEQILENPYHYKPLRGDLHGSRRVHIGSFVLVYEVRESDKTVLILDYEHHDKVY